MPSQALLIAAIDVACLLRERDAPGARLIGAGEVDMLRVEGAQRRVEMCDVRRLLGPTERGVGIYSSSVSLSLSSSASSSERRASGVTDWRSLLRPKDNSGTGALGLSGMEGDVLFAGVLDRRVLGREEGEGLGLGSRTACGSSKDLRQCQYQNLRP